MPCILATKLYSPVKCTVSNCGTGSRGSSLPLTLFSVEHKIWEDRIKANLFLNSELVIELTVKLKWSKCLLHLQKRLQLSKACSSLQYFSGPGAQPVTTPNAVVWSFRSSAEKMLLVHADYSMLNLCLSEDARNPDVISKAYFRVCLDKARFVSIERSFERLRVFG